ncbi:sepiapterin reductase [Pseudomyrmex gracilis]|uniref:sepiapterin reductase n=1 Tax=Pseudomyrmex gracilis TaxID=219809 RepID=UPI00099522BF|nr:sepiapterin reductase [Pseudomyrmex gracilis]XP_020282183.1 sepiapterin reductase [Pseudomyrmex gracilis]XP_020282184.1 sepiapterin reductase [Pseudomyrmex gracilis]
MSIEALSGKVFLLITGASRGIGRQIAITFGSLLQQGSHVLLLARSENALQEVAKSISSNVIVHTVSIDLAKATETILKEAISGSLKNISYNEFDRVVVVHNVGTMGNINKVVNELTDLNTWREFYDVNFLVPAVLNAVVMNTFDNNTKKMVINITSLFAIQAQVGCGEYCSVKAAREMYFKVFALENPDVDVLSYSPGPVDTDMFEMAREKIVDSNARKLFNDMREKNTVLTTEQTVNRLVQVLKVHKYKSADHVDYYDEL